MKRLTKRTVSFFVSAVIIFGCSICGFAYLICYPWGFYPAEMYVDAVPYTSQVNVERQYISATNSYSIVVTNLGDAAYVRVKEIQNWKTSTSKIVGGTPDTTGTLNTDEWVLHEGYYYCKHPMQGFDGTSVLFSNFDFTGISDLGASKLHNFLVEAIQVEPVSTVADTWGVSIDANGNII